MKMKTTMGCCALLLSLTTAAIVCAAELAPTSPAKEIEMVIFGNSYSGWAKHLPRIAKERGQNINLLGVGTDRPFGQPPKPGERAEAPDVNKLTVSLGGIDDAGYSVALGVIPPKAGKPYPEKIQVPLTTVFGFKPWQIVSVQTHSSRANYWDTASYLVSNMQAALKTRVPNARVYYYFTTQYSNVEHVFRNITNASSQDGHIRDGHPYTEDQHYFDALQVALRVEREYGAVIVPGGTALQNARYDSRWGFNDIDPNFDYFRAKEPARPVDSDHYLRMGFVWRPKKDGHYAWSFDSHPNTRLSYFAACVWYEVITGKSPVKSTYVPEPVLGRSLTAEQCRVLQEIAHETVLGVLPPLRLSHPESRQQYGDILWQRAEAMRASDSPEKEAAALKNYQHLVICFPEHPKVETAKALLAKAGKLESTKALAAEELKERPIRERRFKAIWDLATKKGVDFTDDKVLGRWSDL